MNRLLLAPAWAELKSVLKERYQNLTDRELAEIENCEDDWLKRIRFKINGSTFEIALLVEEVTNQRARRSRPQPRVRTHVRSAT